MKRHLALLLAFCMLLTSFPIRSVYADGQKDVPSGIVFDTASGDLEIGFSDVNPNAEQSDWMRSITSIKLNNQSYYREGTPTGEASYKFDFDEDEGKIIIDNHVLVLPENSIEIAAQGYTFYKGVIKNKNIKKMADGLTIISIETGKSSTDPIGTYVGVRLRYDHDSADGGALNYLLKNNVERVVIDGKTLNHMGSDNYPNLLWQDGVFRTWDKMKDATAIVENFGNKTAHEFKIIMKDGSEVIKTEEGYVDEKNVPAPNEKLSQVNTGGMAAGLEIDGVGTPEKLGNALILSSDTPREQWHERYFQNIRYILVDDNKGRDLSPSPANFFVDAKKDTEDLTLFNGKLEFAMTGLKLSDNEPHKIEIGFKDGNTITYTQAGYVAPKDIKFDVKKYIEKEDKKQKPETGNENTLAKRFQIDHIGFSKNYTGNYDYSTPKIFFKNLPPRANKEESNALEEAMKNASFQVNGGEKITNVQGWITRGMTECFEAYSTSEYGGPALGEVLKQAGEDPHIVVTFSDGSVWDNKLDESGHETPEPETGKKDKYPIQNIIFKINGTSPQLELDFGSAQKAKEVGNEIKTIKINGKAYDKSTFGFSMVTDRYISNDEEIGKALYGKSKIKVDITFNDDTTATKTVTITPVEDPNAPQVQPETPKMITKTDNATKVSVEYPEGAFKDGTELKVVNVAGDQFVNENPAVKGVAEKAKAVTAFDISLLFNGVKQQPNREVTVILPLGDHDKDSMKVYHYDKEGKAAPELVKGVKIQGDKIVFEADKFSYYFVTSGVKEEPGDTRKLNERFAIEEVKAETSSYGSKSLKIFFKNYPKQNERDVQKALAKAIKEATFIVNGGEPIKNVEGYCSYGSANAFDVISKSLKEAIEKAGENPHIKVVFSDGSEWENRRAGEVPAKTDNFDLTDKLPDGEYTIQFITSREGETTDFPMVSGIIGNRAKLVVENGKMMLSLRVGKMTDQILDLGMKIDGQFKSGVKTTDGLKQEQAVYTCEVKDLDQIQKLAVLVKAMGGSADKIGQFDSYTKADLHFKAPIKKGFTGYDDPTDPEEQKKRNHDNLTLKLLDAGVKDLDNDGKLSPEELNKATGHLDLSGEKIAKTPDISMLKDLGPGVTGIELSGNDITEIPEGLFDKMTSVTHINIYGNKLETLPKGIFDKNENLSTLWMSGNKLKDLDKDLLAKNERIKEIDLSNNGLENLPGGFLKDASRLESIYAYDNKLTSLDGVLAGNYRRLKVINVSGNQLTSLPEAFGNYKSLEELRANNNKLKALPKAMDQLNRLVILDLENNEIESLPDSLWLRMADNANQYATKYPNLIVKGNILKDIPFDKIAEKASGQRVRFNKFDVSCNYLKSALTDAELATIKKAGVTIKDTHDNYYQPQLSAINAQVGYADGKVKVSQDLDLLQMFYWNSGDIRDWKFFKNPDEYKAFVENTIYKKYGIRTGNEQHGIAQVLDKDGWDWKIQNIIEKIDGNKATIVYEGFVKNMGHNDVESEIDPVDSLNPIIEAVLDPGANYKLTRRLILSKNKFETEFKYSVDFKTPANTPSQEDTKLKKAKDALMEAIAAAEAKLNDGNDYTDGTKQAVMEQLAAADKALKGNDAEAMNTTKAALDKAVKALEVKPAVSEEDAKFKEAKDSLTQAIQEAKNKLSDGKKYTAETKGAVEKAIAKAEEVLAGKDKAAMDKAKGDLEKAVAGLKVETQKPQPQPQPQPKPAPTPTPQPKPAPTPKPSDDKKDKPSSGSSGWTSFRPGGSVQSAPAKPAESKPIEQPKATETKQNFTVNVPKEAFVKGYPDGSFKPNQQVVRSELATMLARFVTVNTDMAKQMNDIRPGDWYFDSFKTLVDAGIISGYGDNNYRPHDGVTRAQAVTMIAKLKGLQPKAGGFKDVPGNAWYAGYAGAAQEAGIVVGYKDGSFGGDRVVTRAEMIAMINRAFNIPKKESRKAFSDLPEDHWAYEDIQKAAN